MSDIASETQQPATGNPSALIDQLNAWADDAQPRRRGPVERFPIASVLQLIPMDNAGNQLCGEAFQVVGKDLSTRGIAFSHLKPLQCRRAVISYSHQEAGRFTAELEVMWSKPTTLGHFESGCRLIRKMPNCELRCTV